MAGEVFLYISVEPDDILLVYPKENIQLLRKREDKGNFHLIQIRIQRTKISILDLLCCRLYGCSDWIIPKRIANRGDQYQYGNTARASL